jgi:hypothetical protein
VTTMLADVVIGVQFAALATDDDNILIANLHGQVATRLDQLALVPGIPPVAVENGFLLLLQDIGIQVLARRDRKRVFRITIKR